MVQLMPLHLKTPSSFALFKSRLVLPFWYRLSQVVPEKRQLNGCNSSSSGMHHLTVFKMAVIHHLGMLKLKFLNYWSGKDRSYCDFCDFQDGSRHRLGFSKIPKFNGLSAYWPLTPDRYRAARDICMLE